MVMVRSTMTVPDSRRLRLLALLVSRCRRPAFRRETFPLPVRWNRFFTPLCVFIFGIAFVLSRCVQLLGATTMIRFRPSMRGAYSIVPTGVSSAITLLMTDRPIS